MPQLIDDDEADDDEERGRRQFQPLSQGCGNMRCCRFTSGVTLRAERDAVETKCRSADSANEAQAD